MNKFLKTIVVAPMATNLNKYPTRISIRSNDKKGMIAIDQFQTMENQRIIKIFDFLSISKVRKFKEVLEEAFLD